MSKLNKDVLFLILEEFQYDSKSLYSCLSVNRTLCKIAVSILWKNPLGFFPTDYAETLLFDVILLHLPKEFRDNGILVEQYRQPSFNYIGFWKHLDLQDLYRMIAMNAPSRDLEIL